MREPRKWDCPTTEVIYEYTDHNRVWIIVCKYEFRPTPGTVISDSFQKPPEIHYHAGVMLNVDGKEYEFCLNFYNKEETFDFVQTIKEKKIQFTIQFNPALMRYDWKWLDKTNPKEES